MIPYIILKVLHNLDKENQINKFKEYFISDLNSLKIIVNNIIKENDFVAFQNLNILVYFLQNSNFIKNGKCKLFLKEKKIEIFKRMKLLDFKKIECQKNQTNCEQIQFDYNKLI